MLHEGDKVRLLKTTDTMYARFNKGDILTVKQAYYDYYGYGFVTVLNAKNQMLIIDTKFIEDAEDTETEQSST